MDRLERARFARGRMAAAGATMAVVISAAFATPSPGADGAPGPYVREGVPHPGADQVYWVPTFAQAQRAAARTGRLMLVMGSVSDFSGY